MPEIECCEHCQIRMIPDPFLHSNTHQHTERIEDSEMTLGKGVNEKTRGRQSFITSEDCPRVTSYRQTQNQKGQEEVRRRSCCSFLTIGSLQSGHFGHVRVEGRTRVHRPHILHSTVTGVYFHDLSSTIICHLPLFRPHQAE